MSFFASKPAEVPAAEPQDTAELLALRGEVKALRHSQAVIEFNLDGTILDANDNFLNALGYTLDEVRGQHHRMFVTPTDAASPEYAQFWKQLGSGAFDAGEYKRIAKDGSEIWIQASYNPVFDEAGRPIKVVKYAADITARKVEQAELNGMVNAISVSQAVIEFQLDGTIVSANDNFLAATGYTLEEIRGKHHRMFCKTEYTETNDYKRFWEDLARGDYKEAEFQRLGKGGREIWLQAIYNPILDPSGRPVKVIKIASNITSQIATKQKAAQVGDSVASSVSEMVSTIEEIARSVSLTASLAQDAEGVATLTGTHVAALGDSSRKIGEVVGVIQELADQTNLLALNATIEAARAGESGRSFAVVASEVKELANATANATQNIEVSVREIQESIVKVVESTDKITAGISEVSSNTTTVAAAIEEQSATMAGLGETAGELQSITAGV